MEIINTGEDKEIPGPLPRPALIARLDDPVATEMFERYLGLLQDGVTNLDEWREVHRLLPSMAEQALMLAACQSHPLVMARVLFVMTQSPAMLFADLGDGVGFSERNRFAAFTSVQSAQRFRARFPEWKVYVAEKPPQIEDVRDRVLRDTLGITYE